MNSFQDRDAFKRLVAALEPWLDHVVIIGGWAHRLYRLHPHAQELTYPPLTTLDADVAVPADLPAREQDIRARLVAQGFTEEFLGEDQPPATHYHLGGESSGFYAEFLTPLVGGEYDRKHRRKATVEITGIVSQKLRYIELLLRHTWSIDFESDGSATRILNPEPRRLPCSEVPHSREARASSEGHSVHARHARGLRRAPPGDARSMAMHRGSPTAASPHEQAIESGSESIW